MKICTQCTETQSADRQLPALGRTVSELFSLVNHVVKKLSWKELSRSKETLDGPNYAQHGLLEIDEKKARGWSNLWEQLVSPRYTSTNTQCEMV